MGSIRRVATDRVYSLEAEHLVGRAVASSLRLEQRYVSTHHAVLRWADEHWEVKDLGSRNGTFLNGQRLQAGVAHPVDEESTIAFGNVAQEQWQVVDTGAPLPMAVPLEGGDPMSLEGGLLALPSADDPVVTIYRTADGAFAMDSAEASSRITNLTTFPVRGRLWRFSCPDDLRTASLTVSRDVWTARQMALSFSVSSDEEHVQIQMHHGGRAIDMGARVHNYMLLTLARARLKDAESGLADGACGWLHQDELRSDPSQMSLEIFRIRKHFARAGVVDGGNVIERRRDTRQLRIGTGNLTIHRV